MWIWNKMIRWGLLIGWFAFGMIIHGQSFYSRQVTTDDGLPSNTIRSICRPQGGYTWIGTDGGVVRWDGQRTVFSKKQGLPSNKVYALAEGNAGDMWVGTYDGGLCLMRGDKVIRVFTSHDGLASNYLSALYYSRNQEQLFVGTRQGLSVGDSSGFYSYRSQKLDVVSFQENDTSMWLSTASQGMFSYHFQRKTVVPVKTISDINGKGIYQFLFTTQGDSLYAVRDSGIWVVNGPQRSFVPFRSTVVHFEQGQNDDVWIVSSESESIGSSGLFLLRRGELILFNEHLSFRPKSVNALWMEPESGTLFVGTSGNGFMLLPPLKFEQYEAKSETHHYLLSDICEDKDNNLWVVGDKQWKIPLSQSPRTDHIVFRTQFYHDYLFDEGFQGDFINSIFPLPNGLIRLSGSRISFFKDGTRRPEALIPEIGLCDFLQVINNQLIVQRGEQLNVYCFPDMKLCKSLFCDAKVRQVVQNKGRVWLLFDEGNIICLDSDFKVNDDLTHQLSLLSSSFSLMTVDKRGNMLLSDGTESLWMMGNTNDRPFLKGKWQIGKDFPGNVMHWMLVDRSENLWLGTDKGLSKLDLSEYFDTGKKHLMNWGRGEGYDATSSFKAIETNNGWIWVLSPSRVTRFWPSAMEENSLSPKTKLAQITKNGRRVDVDELVRTRFFGGQHNDIDLASNENNLMFAFDVQDLNNSEKVLYRFQLLPLDKEYGVASRQASVYYPALSPGRYKLRVQSYFEHSPGKVSELEYPFTINPPLHRSIYAFIFYAILTIIVVWLILDVRVRRVKKKEEQKNKTRERMALLKMEALQSQMNPHFIFNALNSLQCSVLENDVEKSLHFIGLFSRLMRSTLDNASHHLITLKDEIEYIENYMQVEKMRYSDGFEYAISVADNIETEAFYLPPMLLQPHVENSIKYAFTSTSIGYIIISFSKIDNKLICMVEDNGVGRETTQSRRRTHRPKGQSITRERFEILNEFYQTFNEYKFEVEDLFDQEMKPSGTRVTLIFPLITQAETYLKAKDKLYEID